MPKSSSNKTSNSACFFITTLCLLFIVYCLLFIVSPVSAQTISPSPKITTVVNNSQTGEVLGIWDNLINFFKNIFAEKKIPEDVDKFNRSSLPPVEIGTAIVSQQSLDQGNQAISPFQLQATSQSTSDEVADVAFKYDLSNSTETPEEITTDPASFFDKIKAFFSDILGGTIQEGNESARDFVAVNTPPGVAEEILARVSQDQLLAQTDSTNKVLQAYDEQRYMAYAVDARRCTVLPGVGDCLNSGLLNPPESPTPTLEAPPADVSPPPAEPIAPPSECGGVAGSGDFYYDYNVGKCKIMTKGYCSVSCLKPYFDNDETTAKKASQLCQAESGGDPFAINYGCLRPDVSSRTQEYSVGLFQINLWFDERCAGALSDQIADTSVDPPLYSCRRGPNFDQCTQSFQDPAVNYGWAYKLYDRKRTYVPDANPWGDWSTALPENCDVK